jgi:cytochrome P450
MSNYAKRDLLSDKETYSDRYVFGNGPHICPGEKLAHNEIVEFVRLLGKGYVIKTDQKNIQQVGHVTMSLSEPIKITIERRS